MVTQLDKYNKSYWIVHLKWVNFMECKMTPQKTFKNYMLIKYYNAIFENLSQGWLKVVLSVDFLNS